MLGLNHKINVDFISEMPSEAGPCFGVPALLRQRIPKAPKNEEIWHLHSTGTVCGCKNPNREARLGICREMKQPWSTWSCSSLPNSSHPPRGCGSVLTQLKKPGTAPQNLTLQGLLPPCSATAATCKELSLFRNSQPAPKQRLQLPKAASPDPARHFSSPNKTLKQSPLG